MEEKAYCTLPAIKLHTCATEEDMVRTRVLKEGKWITMSEIHAERTTDLALVSALASVTDMWPNQPIDLIAYTDAHGTWCVECGNGVVSATTGGHVCPMVGCANHDPHTCPTREYT